MTNQNPILKYVKLYPEVKDLEKRVEDAGYDVYYHPKEDEIGKDVFIQPGEIVKLGTGIKVACPNDYMVEAMERGSTGMKCMSLRGRVVDSGYRGEIQIAINNTSNNVIVITSDQEKTKRDIMVEMKKEFKYKRNMREEERIRMENFIDKIHTFHDSNAAIAQIVLKKIDNTGAEQITEEEYDKLESQRQDNAYGSSDFVVECRKGSCDIKRL